MAVVLTVAGMAATNSRIAQAADYYLRAGAGVHRPAEAAFEDRDYASVSPAALYGCWPWRRRAPKRSAGGFGTAPI